MSFYEVTFMNFQEQDDTLYCHIGPPNCDPASIHVSINSSPSNRFGRGGITLHLSERRLIALKNSMIGAYEKYKRAKKEIKCQTQGTE